jgi:hypothetical protein
MIGGRSVLALRAKVPGPDEATFARMTIEAEKNLSCFENPQRRDYLDAKLI